MQTTFSATRVRITFDEAKQELSILFGSEGAALKINFTQWTRGLQITADVKVANKNILNALLFNAQDYKLSVSQGFPVSTVPVMTHETVLPEIPEEAKVHSPKRRGRPKKNGT